jgi:hypothetical protein
VYYYGDAFKICKIFIRCVPTGRASSDFASLQNILRMVPLRVLRIPRAIGSPSGPENPSRKYFMLCFIMGDAFLDSFDFYLD